MGADTKYYVNRSSYLSDVSAGRANNGDGMIKGSEPNKFENWVCILERGTEYEVQLVKNYLENEDIPSAILSKKDSSLTMTIGEMSMVYLYVPTEFEKQAKKAIRDFQENEIDEENDDES
jgi:hypothetical protein